MRKKLMWRRLGDGEWQSEDSKFTIRERQSLIGCGRVFELFNKTKTKVFSCNSFLDCTGFAELL